MKYGLDVFASGAETTAGYDGLLADLPGWLSAWAMRTNHAGAYGVIRAVPDDGDGRGAIVGVFVQVDSHFVVRHAV